MNSKQDADHRDGGLPLAIDLGRLATSIDGLAARAGTGAVGADLHALAGILRNLDRGPNVDRDVLEQELRNAMAAGEEPAAIAAAQRLAAADRANLATVDWTAASGG